MNISWSLRLASATAGLILIALFTSAQAADTLGAWTAKNPGLSPDGNYQIYGMAYGKNTYVIVGQDLAAGKAFAANSTDGTNWTLRPTASASEVFNSVIFSKGRFIAVCSKPASGNACIWTSDNNGSTWTARSSDLVVDGSLNGVAGDGNGKLVAVGEITGVWNGWITYSSDNGNTWKLVRDGATYKTIPTKLFGVGYALGNWYALGSNGVYKSNGADCEAWTYPEADSSQFYTQSDDLPGYKFASNKATIVAASLSGPKWSDDNGANWNDGAPAPGFEGVASIYSWTSSVTYAEGLFVVASRRAGDVWISEDGRTWERRTLPTLDETYALCYGNKSFWCGGVSETLAVSAPWLKARTGGSSDFPYTLFDAQDTPPNHVGLPQYRVNTASLNLVMEGTLFYMKTLGAPINLKLVYNSQPCADDATNIGPFGKNWRFRYESVVGRSGKNAQLVNGGGRSFTFTTPKGEDLDTYAGPETALTLKSPEGIYDKLVYKYAVPSFELTLKASHLKYTYAVTDSNSGGSQFHLSSISDQFGNTTTFDIDTTSGAVKSITDSSSRTINFTYNPDSATGLCTGMSMLGRSVIFSYTGKNLTGIADMKNYSGSYAYDSNGFITSMTTEGVTTTFTYKDRVGVSNGDKSLATVTRPGAYGTIKYEIQEDGKTVKRTDPGGQTTLITNAGGLTTSIKDPLGNVRSFAFNSAKLPETVTDEKGGSCKYEYDSRGNMTRKTDALGNITKFYYDPASDDMTRMEDAFGYPWVYAYSNYQPTSVTTPFGNISYFFYDGQGRLTTLRDARGNDTTFTYDKGEVATVASSASGTTTLVYDAASRCISIQDANLKTKSLSWDNNDRLERVTYDSVTGTPSYFNGYSAFGQTSFQDELGEWTYATRDDLGSITTILDPNNKVTQMEYDMDNRLIKTVDPLLRSTSTSYDSAGRPVIFTDARSYQVVREYDSTGNLVSFRDSNNSTTTYKYDANGRLLSVMDPLLKYNTMTRTKTGQIASTKNARSHTINYSYDFDGRLTDKVPATATTPATKVNYVRDPNGNVTRRTDSLTTAAGTTTSVTDYVYDASNRVTKITYPDLKEVNLEWFPGGQLKKIIYPDNNLAVTYTYDDFNRIAVPSVLKNNPGTDLVGERRSTNAITKVAVTGDTTGDYDLTYNDRGQITQMLRPNGTKSAYSYDAAGRLTGLRHSVAADDSNLFTSNDTLDAVGNVTKTLTDGIAYYQGASLPDKMALLYNAGGELTKKGIQACTSDADGNLTNLGAGTTVCTYDADNRLTKIVRKITAPVATTETILNTFDSDGYRTKRVNGDETINYHYLPSGLLLFTTDAAGVILDRHIYAGNALLSTYTSGGDWIDYYGDRQANVRFMADSSLNVLAKYDYLPYGQVASDPVNTLVENPFTFNGILGVQDERNGLFYMQQRFYDASTARFLGRDPLGFSAGNNLYEFGKNNPMIYADPTGRTPFLLFLAAASAAYYFLGAAESHDNANANAAEINAKYRQKELEAKKKFNETFKGNPKDFNQKLANAQKTSNMYERGLSSLFETTEQVGNRAGEAGELAQSAAENVALGDSLGSIWDAAKAVYTDFTNESAEENKGKKP
ncbi:MAG: RHS repeat-associated core domain-containing protein [Victivallales bacterium]